MSSESEPLDLNQLSELADVTPRTVRYYIQQGLIPPPEGRGPATQYDQSHLDRLNLIRRLQRQHLPLAEIRRQMESLSDAAVAGLVSAPEGRGRKSSALDYVRDVLSGRAKEIAVPPPKLARMGSPLARPMPMMPMGALGDPEREDLAMAPPDAALAPGMPPPGDLAAPSRSGERSQWERVALAPDVELHVRRPLSREGNKMVERLLAAARDIFRRNEP
ncbi:MAG: MerR family transcriptional regulator [Gemmatimonadaceae bacterium]